jgi:hypothetical protein
MNWSNYGRGQGKWVIDHKLPVVAFDHSRPEQVGKCWHCKNLRALWSVDNCKKSGKILQEFTA